MDHQSLARVGVVIVTHASACDVANALRPLPSAELACVVVVDNASPDETVATVRALDLPNVEVVEQANVGFGAGCDAGRNSIGARADFVLFLNPDAVIEAEDLERLASYLDAHPRCALVAPRLTTTEGAALTAGGVQPTLLTELQPHLPAELGRFLPRRQLAPAATRTGEVGYVEGACMLMRTESVDAVGGFDHRYFLCFEEIDLARRLRNAGWSVDICSEAIAQHAQQRSRLQAPLFSQYHQYRSQRLFLERWSGVRAAKAYSTLARASWRIRQLTGKITKPEYQVRAAAVAGADFPQ